MRWQSTLAPSDAGVAECRSTPMNADGQVHRKVVENSRGCRTARWIREPAAELPPYPPSRQNKPLAAESQEIF